MTPTPPEPPAPAPEQATQVETPATTEGTQAASDYPEPQPPQETPTPPRAPRTASTPKARGRRSVPTRSHEEWQRAIDQAVRKKRAADQKADARAQELDQIIEDAKTQAPAALVEAWRLVAVGVEEEHDR